MSALYTYVALQVLPEEKRISRISQNIRSGNTQQLFLFTQPQSIYL